jgi:HlyD family secretion protein
VTIFDSKGPMQINAKVDESDIAHIAPRMSVRVKVDAFADMTMPGVVNDVAPLPDPSFLFMGDRKVYTTRIRIGQRPDGLRPGLTASAEIVAGELENVLSVPAGAVITYGGEDHVAVKMPDGRVEWRVVVLGASDGANYEVKEGLRSGEKVILEPRPFLSEEQQAKIKSEQEAEAREAAARREAALKAAAAARRQDVPQKSAVRKRGGRGGE